MQNTNTFGVHYTLRRNKSKNGFSPIHARITINKSRVEMSMKYIIADVDWNSNKGCAKPKNNELKKLNTTLEEVRSKLVMVYHELIRGGDLITSEMVKDAYLGIGRFAPQIQKEEEEKKSLRWLMAEHNNIMQTVLTHGTLKNYYSTERYIHKFLDRNFKKKDINLEDISYAFLTNFEYYIRTTPLKQGDPCTNNGVMKHMERMKKISGWAEKNEWIPKDPFANYALKFKAVKTTFLELEELKLIEKKEFAIPMLENIRKIFIFSCYSGLSYVDVMSLNEENIVDGSDRFKWIKHKRAKTDISFNVPLLTAAEKILNEFADLIRKPGETNCFPSISNQEMNRGLKIIGEACEIKKQLTFHLARHTFATTITLANDVPIESISKMMGHTKITTTMIYAKVVNAKISKDMAVLSDKLQGNIRKLRVV